MRAAPLILNEQGNILTSTEKLTNSKADPPDRNPPQHPEERTPEGEGRGSSGFSPPRPAFSLQREYLSAVALGDLVEVAGLDFVVKLYQQGERT